MSFASDADRLALRVSSENSGFLFEYVLRIRKNGNESEFPCDDLEHALSLSGAWVKNHAAEYVEIFRVNEDGSLKATIGAA